MNIIVKLVLKNIQEKKMRTFLIIFSISLSCAFFFATNSFSRTFIKVYREKIKQYFGSADIVIIPNDKYPSATISLQKTDIIKEETEYIIGDFWGAGSYHPSRTENIRLSLRGLYYEDLEKLSPLTFIKKKNLFPFQGKKIIINSHFADSYSIKAGDWLSIKINGIKYKYKVVGIARPTGILGINPEQTSVIIPRDTLAKLFSMRRRVPVALIKVKDPEHIGSVIKTLKKLYPKLSVSEPLNPRQLKEQLQGITVPFFIMTLLILGMSIFIIYVSFKVIVIERIPIIGTFRSIGAEKKTTNLLLLSESCTYGLIGGIIGIVLGILFLYVMTLLMSSGLSGGKTKIVLHISFFHVTTTLLLALGLSVISSLVPIIKISGIPIKEIIFSQTAQAKIMHSSWKTMASFIMLIASMVLPNFEYGSFTLLVNILSCIFLLAGVVLLIPFGIKMSTRLFEGIYVFFFGNMGVIAAKNLKENKNIHNNITLLAIGLAGVLMINIISYSLGLESSTSYSPARFEIWLDLWQADRNTELSIRSVQGVKKTYGIYETETVEVIGGNHKIAIINGVDPRFADFWDTGLEKSALHQLNEGRNIILSGKLKKILGVKKGDVLLLQMDKGKKKYRITGFFDSLRANGNHALISARYYKMDMGTAFFTSIYIKTAAGVSPDDVVKEIKHKFAQRGPYVQMTSELEQSERDSNNQILFILKVISYLTLFIGIVGIVNNLAINFIQRQRSFAMFRSIGMSKIQIIKMLFIESFSGGILGGVIGVATGLCFIFIVQLIMRNLDVDLKIHYSTAYCVGSAATGALISIIASISPVVKISKMNIIDTIKHE